MFRSKLFLFFLLIILLIFAGCAVKLKVLQPPEKASELSYNMAVGQEFTYLLKNSIIQTFDIQGQSIDTEIKKDINFTLIPASNSDNRYQLGVTINEISIELLTPGKTLNPDLEHIPGSKFRMSLNQLGREIVLEDTENLTYVLGPGSERQIANDFNHLLPQLPEHPVKIGDIWTEVDTFDVSDGGMDAIIIMTTKNTLVNFVYLNNHECAKITSEYYGTMESSGRESGRNVSTKINISGNDVWFFDHKLGIFVKLVSSGTGNGTTTIQGQEQVILPVSQKISMEITLVE